MGEEKKQERKYELDLLRILAAYSVVMLHASAQCWYLLDVNGREWKIANGYDAVFRFGVPIFVMLSGALWLDEDKSLEVKRLYTRNIFRLAVVYLVWSFVYAVWDWRTTEFAGGVKALLKGVIYSYYHLWYLPFIICVYVLLPILKSWVQSASKENLQYFLVLFFVLQILRTTVQCLYPQTELLHLLSLLKTDMVCGYLGYFVLGHYLTVEQIPGRLRKMLYAAALPAAVLNIVISTGQSVKAGAATGAIYDSYGLFTFVIVAALFVFFSKKAGKRTYGAKAKRLIKELSADTLGIYVMHIGVMEWLDCHGFYSMTFPIWIGIPILAVVCFLICTLIAALLRRLPFVGRYLC